jgi:hypothetical protein
MKAIPFNGDLLCPDCGRPGLEVLVKEDLGADEKWDEVQVQVVHCPGCGLHSLAQYLENRWGARDIVRHEIVEPEECHVKTLPDSIVRRLGH